MLSFRDIGARSFGVIVILFVDGCLRGVCAKITGWRATGRSSITPNEPLMMAGYASRTTPATQKNMDLWAKTLLLEDRQGNRGVLISLDLVGIGRALSQRVCQRLKESFGMERNQIAIFTSHTHSGPVVGLNLAPMHFLAGGCFSAREKLWRMQTDWLMRSSLQLGWLSRAGGRVAFSGAAVKLYLQ